MTNKGKDLRIFLLWNLALGLPSIIAIQSIKASQKALDLSSNHSPLGYTYSLVLFLLPCLLFGYPLLRSSKSALRRRAFGLTILLLLPLGILLDLLFGSQFFTFPNKSAVLGSKAEWCVLPAYFPMGRGPFGLFSGQHWKQFIPIEEILFYGLGFTALLLTYLWAEASLFPEHKVDPYQQAPAFFRNMWSSAASWLLIGGLLFLVAYGIRLVRNNMDQQAGFPGYFLFLLCASIIPCMLCFQVAFHFVNWKALTVAWLFVLVISQFWEGTLAIPYGWWDYCPERMMGIFLKPQCDLAIEAVLVWSLGSWTTVVVFETVLALLHVRSFNGPKARFLFNPTGPSPRGPGPRILAMPDDGNINRLKTRYQDEIAREAVVKCAINGDVLRLKGLLDDVPGLLNQSMDSQNSALLHLAAHNNQTAVIEELVRRKAPINHPDRDGNTPLMRAVLRGSLEAVQILLRSGAGTNLRNTSGKTPLALARARNDRKIAALLMQHGANE